MNKRFKIKYNIQGIKEDLIMYQTNSENYISNVIVKRILNERDEPNVEDLEMYFVTVDNIENVKYPLSIWL